MSVEFALIDRSTTPPDEFFYKQPESGRVFKTYSYKKWIDEIRSHRLANGYEITADWKEQLEDELCRANPQWGTQICKRINVNPTNLSFSFAAALSFIQMLIKWIRDGARFVDQEEAERRANICSTCPMNTPLVHGCGACMSQLYQALASLLGDRKTQRDDLLGACGICSCSLRAAVHFPLKNQQGNLTPEMVEEFAKLPYCWKGKAA